MLSSEMLRDGFCVNSIPSPAGLPGKQEVGEGGGKSSSKQWECWTCCRWIKPLLFPRFQPFGSSSCSLFNSNLSLFPSKHRQLSIPSAPKVLPSTKKSELSINNWSTTFPKDPRNQEIHGEKNELGDPWENECSVVCWEHLEWSMPLSINPHIFPLGIPLFPLN